MKLVSGSKAWAWNQCATCSARPAVRCRPNSPPGDSLASMKRTNLVKIWCSNASNRASWWKNHEKTNLLFIYTVPVYSYSSYAILNSSLNATPHKGNVMTTLNSSFGSRFGLEYMPTSFLVRMGKREVLVCRDFRKRYYAVNPIMECDTGVQAGHLEVLMFRRWLLILSKAH